MAPNANIIEIPIETYGINEHESNFRQGTVTTHREFSSYEHYHQSHPSNQTTQSALYPQTTNTHPPQTIQHTNDEISRLTFADDTFIRVPPRPTRLTIDFSPLNDMQFNTPSIQFPLYTTTFLEAEAASYSVSAFSQYLAIRIDQFTKQITVTSPLKQPSLLMELVKLLSFCNPNSKRLYIKQTTPKSPFIFIKSKIIKQKQRKHSSR